MFSLIPLYVRVLAILLLALACLSAGVVGGMRIESNKRDAEYVKQLRSSIVVSNKESDRREAVGAQREVVREKIRVVYVKIKNKALDNVDKNTDKYADCGLDDDGLRIWNAANSGSAETLPGKSDSAMPGTESGAVGESVRPAGESRGGYGTGGAMPGSTEKAG